MAGWLVDILVVVAFAQSALLSRQGSVEGGDNGFRFRFVVGFVRWRQKITKERFHDMDSLSLLVFVRLSVFRSRMRLSSWLPPSEGGDYPGLLSDVPPDNTQDYQTPPKGCLHEISRVIFPFFFFFFYPPFLPPSFSYPFSILACPLSPLNPNIMEMGLLFIFPTSRHVCVLIYLLPQLLFSPPLVYTPSRLGRRGVGVVTVLWASSVRPSWPSHGTHSPLPPPNRKEQCKESLQFFFFFKRKVTDLRLTVACYTGNAWRERRIHLVLCVCPRRFDKK